MASPPPRNSEPIPKEGLDLPDPARHSYEQHVRTLEAFGHRGSATAHERQAAEYLAAELKALGLDPAVEAFAAKPSMPARLLLHVAVAAAGACLLWAMPLAGGVLGLVALVSLIVEQSTRGLLLSRLLPNRPSQNVRASFPPAPGPARRRLIVCAHYDTQRTGLIWHDAAWRRLTPVLGRLPAALQSPLLPVAWAMGAQCVVAVAASGTVRWEMSFLPAAVLLAVYAVTAWLLIDWMSSPFVPGASDNASGVAGALAVAEAWKAAPHNGVELVVLFTGCEESGLLGAMAWIDRHRQELRALPTVFLNLDGLGFGPPRLLAKEIPGAGLPLNYPPELLARCTPALADEPSQEGRLLTVPGYTDGLAFLARGLPGVTLVGSQSDGRLPHWHLPTDNTSHMDFENAWLGAQLATRLVARLTEGISTADPNSAPGPGAGT